MKVIRVNTPTGQFDVPLEKVAQHRANHYETAGTPQWDEEVDYVMNDDFEGIDWMLNNSDWIEWSEIAERVNTTVKVTEDDFFTCSDDFDIVEK